MLDSPEPDTAWLLLDIPAGLPLATIPFSGNPGFRVRCGYRDKQSGYDEDEAHVTVLRIWRATQIQPGAFRLANQR
jgi:hypothetical protein